MNDLQNGVFNKHLSFELNLQRPSVDDSVEDGNGQQEQQEQTTTVARTIHGAPQLRSPTVVLRLRFCNGLNHYNRMWNVPLES